jgi:hypothetical protein
MRSCAAVIVAPTRDDRVVAVAMARRFGPQTRLRSSGSSAVESERSKALAPRPADTALSLYRLLRELGGAPRTGAPEPRAWRLDELDGSVCDRKAQPARGRAACPGRANRDLVVAESQAASAEPAREFKTPPASGGDPQRQLATQDDAEG